MERSHHLHDRSGEKVGERPTVGHGAAQPDQRSTKLKEEMAALRASLTRLDRVTSRSPPPSPAGDPLRDPRSRRDSAQSLPDGQERGRLWGRPGTPATAHRARASSAGSERSVASLNPRRTPRSASSSPSRSSLPPRPPSSRGAGTGAGGPHLARAAPLFPTHEHPQQVQGVRSSAGAARAPEPATPAVPSTTMPSDAMPRFAADPAGGAASGPTATPAQEGADALAADFNEFFNDLADKYGLFTPGDPARGDGAPPFATRPAPHPPHSHRYPPAGYPTASQLPGQAALPYSHQSYDGQPRTGGSQARQPPPTPAQRAFHSSPDALAETRWRGVAPGDARLDMPLHAAGAAAATAGVAPFEFAVERRRDARTSFSPIPAPTPARPKTRHGAEPPPAWDQRHIPGPTDPVRSGSAEVFVVDPHEADSVVDEEHDEEGDRGGGILPDANGADFTVDVRRQRRGSVQEFQSVAQTRPSHPPPSPAYHQHPSEVYPPQYERHQQQHPQEQYNQQHLQHRQHQEPQSEVYQQGYEQQAPQHHPERRPSSASRPSREDPSTAPFLERADPPSPDTVLRAEALMEQERARRQEGWERLQAREQGEDGEEDREVAGADQGRWGGDVGQWRDDIGSWLDECKLALDDSGAAPPPLPMPFSAESTRVDPLRHPLPPTRQEGSDDRTDCRPLADRPRELYERAPGAPHAARREVTRIHQVEDDVVPVSQTHQPPLHSDDWEWHHVPRTESEDHYAIHDPDAPYQEALRSSGGSRREEEEEEEAFASRAPVPPPARSAGNLHQDTLRNPGGPMREERAAFTETRAESPQPRPEPHHNNYNDHDSGPQRERATLPLPSHNPPRPALEATSVKALNQALRDNGFAGVTSGSTNQVKPAEMLRRMVEVLGQYERRSNMVQELLASNEMARQREEKAALQLKRLRQERDAAKLEADKNRAKFEDIWEKSSNGSQLEEENLRKSQQGRDKLMQKVSQLEHTCRSKEHQLQRMQSKLEDKIRKEEHRATRDKEVYERIRRQLLQGKSAVAAGTKTMKPVDVVSLYEAKLQASERDLAALRAEVKQLSAELKDRDNLISRKDRGGGWRTPESADLIAHKEDAQRSFSDAQRELASTEAKAAQAQRAAALQISQAEERAASLAEENANLIFEIESRPSVKQLRDAERRADKLQQKLDALRAGTAETGDDPDTQDMARRLGGGPITNKEKINRDRNIHRLQLHRVERLPKDLVVELVQSVCIQLELTDPALLEGAILKLLRVVGAVPRMEKFIGEVCEVVFGEGYAHVDTGLGRKPQAVPAILRGWLGSIRTLADLQEFRLVVVHELNKRAGGSGMVRESAPPADLARQVKDLVEMERVHLLTQNNFENAEAMLENKPEVLINKIVKHFQHLFATPQLEGVLAKMNNVYMQTTEQRNFMRVLRQLLGLEDGAGVNACLARIRSMLDKEALEFDLKSEYVMGKLDRAKTFQMGPHEAPKPANNMEFNPEQLGQHVRITNSLLALFGLAEPSKIVPHSESILERLHKLEDVLPRYQGLTNQLFDVLRVNTLDEILPSVRAMAAAQRF